MTGQARKAAKWLGRGLIVIFVAVLLVASAAAVLFKTSWGQGYIEETLESRVSNAIPGTMRIEELNEIKLLSPPGSITMNLTDLRFMHPQGEEVIYIEDAEVAVDPFALIAGSLHFHRAHVDGGRVEIIARGKGPTEIEQTFSDKTQKSASGDSKSGDPIGIDLEAVQVRGLTLLIRPGEDSKMVIRYLSGNLHLFLDDQDKIAIDLRHFTGTVTEASFMKKEIDLRQVNGRVRGKGPRVVDLDFVAAVAGGKVSGEFAFNPTQEKKVRVKLDPEEGIKVHLGAIAATVRTALGDGEVAVKLE